MPVISLFLLLVVSPLQTGSVDPARLFEAGETWERFLERVERQRERWLRTAADATVAPTSSSVSSVPGVISNSLLLPKTGAPTRLIRCHMWPD